MGDEPEEPTGEQIPELAYVWRDLSELVQQARSTPVPAASNEALEHQLNSDPDGPLAPPMLLWMGDNLVMEKQFDEAIEAYRRLVDRFPDRLFGEATWASLALERLADCQARLGRPEEGVEALHRIIDSHPQGRSLSSLHYRAGQVAENAGRLEEAEASYERATTAPNDSPETQASIPDLARRDLERLRSNRDWMRPEAEAVAKELARFLEAGNGDALDGLASRTHFSLGVLNGESMFVDRRRLLDVIGDELRRSKVRTDPFSLQGTGDKRYLETEGWEGSFLRNRVVLLLTHALEGWEWSGVAVTEFPEATWGEILGPPERGSNQPLSLTIKSPWPRGLTLRAGGIIPFTIQLVRCAGAGPYPLPLLCIFRLAASSPCGLGPGGLYYGGVAGFNFTHGGDDFFAIDFARYRFGVPLQNQTFGTQVLAVQMGMVSGVNAAIATGATSTDNRVLVKHLTEADFIMIVILEILSGRPLRPFATPRFTSMYLHLDGPFKIPVSPGMFVRQGANLGAMDDTGRSLHHHLHFSIHDRAVTGTQAEGALTPAGRSVRPNPMDGQRLLDFDDGACVFSTNI